MTVEHASNDHCSTNSSGIHWRFIVRVLPPSSVSGRLRVAQPSDHEGVRLAIFALKTSPLE